jgi:hypothetical protein
VLIAAVLLGACTASPGTSGSSAVGPSTPVQSPGSMTSPRPSPSLLPEAAWTSITWAASDPAPFSGPGNQFVFGGVPWAGGTVLVGEEVPLPSGNVEGVVWKSPDNAHWQRIPNTGGTFSGSEIEAVAASASTLVAVGDSRLEDSATTLTPPLGIAWTSMDGTHWQRVADGSGVLGNIVLHAVVAGSTGFLALGNDLAGQTALAFSSDGVHWRREDTEAVFGDSNISGITWTGRDFAAVGSHNVAQPSGVISQTPGNAAAWWSSDGLDWHPSDVGSTGYALESVQSWIDSLRASGVPPCPGCISAPAEWRSSDDGRTWRQLPLPPTPDYPGLESLLVGQRLVSLQDQPQRATWSADGQTWKDLEMNESPIPDTTQLMVAAGQTVIAIASVTGASANDQEDMRVFAGQLH